MSINSKTIDIVSSLGHIAVLDWWVKTATEFGFVLEYVEAIDLASRHGIIDILNWWKLYCDQNNLEFKYSEKAVDLASTHYHIDVLNWWKNMLDEHDLPMKYSHNAIDNVHFFG